METIIKNTQDKLAEITDFKYIDEDTGQLDQYSPHFTVKFPCALVDISDVDFTNLGQDHTKDPVNRQMGNGLIKVTIANMKLGNTSFKAPIGQKNIGWSVWQTIDKVHKKLHGSYVAANSGKLIRSSIHRIKRDDGVQQYEVYYKLDFKDV